MRLKYQWRGKPCPKHVAISVEGVDRNFPDRADAVFLRDDLMLVLALTNVLKVLIPLFLLLNLHAIQILKITQRPFIKKGVIN
jgi:hypothetical protein